MLTDKLTLKTLTSVSEIFSMFGPHSSGGSEVTRGSVGWRVTQGGYRLMERVLGQGGLCLLSYNYNVIFYIC